MADFETADRITAVNEGGKAPDGAVFGIDPVAHPDINMAALKPDAAADIRYKGYWLPIKGFLLNRQEIANKLYDASVHHGPGEAARIAQNAFNDLYPRNLLAVDGAMGARAVLAINEMPAWHVRAYVNTITYERVRFMLEVLAREPAKEPERVGWIRRV